MIRIVTIDREYGAGGSDIAKRLADRLNWKLLDELLTHEIARIMNCEEQAVEEREEHRDSLQYRLFRAFMRGSFEGASNAQRLGILDADCIRQTTEALVLEAAKEGQCVIVGRGSVYYLQSDPEAFHVFIYAPLEEKVRRLRHREGCSEREARSLAETVDRDRAAYIKEYFHVQWPDRSLYDLMVNSAIGDEASVTMILDAISAFQRSEPRV